MQQVININADLDDLQHYNNTLALQGDISAVLGALTARLEAGYQRGAGKAHGSRPARQEAASGRVPRGACSAAPLHDDVWQQARADPAAAIPPWPISAKATALLKLFDAGDVQANGFQIVRGRLALRHAARNRRLLHGLRRQRPSGRRARRRAALCRGLHRRRLLHDEPAGADRCGASTASRGMIVLFDNRRMAAISGLQDAQYSGDYRTSDDVAVDYVRAGPAVKGVFACHGGTTRAELESALERATGA